MFNLNLNQLSKHGIKNEVPTDFETVHYLFWEKGIDLNTFNELPLPYIFSIIKTHAYYKKEEEKESKRLNKK